MRQSTGRKRGRGSEPGARLRWLPLHLRGREAPREKEEREDGRMEGWGGLRTRMTQGGIGLFLFVLWFPF